MHYLSSLASISFNIPPRDEHPDTVPLVRDPWGIAQVAGDGPAEKVDLVVSMLITRLVVPVEHGLCVSCLI